MTNTAIDYSSDIDMEGASADLQRANSTGGGGGRRNTAIFKPKPSKDGQIYTNKLFFASVRPQLVPGFERYPNDRRLPYVKVPGHYVEVPIDNGKKRTAFVLCKKKMNEYAAGLAKDERYMMFEDDSCPDCESAQGAWDQYNARWEQLGYPDKESRKGLSKDEYKGIASDPQLEALKKAAMEVMSKDRYYFPVYDLERQPLEIGYQWLGAAEKIFKDAMDLITAGVKFWSLNPHPTVENAIEGAQMLLKRDNTNGARFCEYSLKDDRTPLALNPEEVVYLMDQANLPPLFADGVVEVWTYEQLKEARMNGVVPDSSGEEGAQQEPPRAAYGGAPATRTPAAPAPRAAANLAARPAPAPQPAASSTTRAAPASAPRPAAAARPASAPASQPAARPAAGAPAPAARPAAAAAPGARKVW